MSAERSRSEDTPTLEEQVIVDLARVAEVVVRVARARRRGAAQHRRDDSLARVGSAEMTIDRRAPRGWAYELATYGTSQTRCLDRQAALRAGGDTEAAHRASAGAAMLDASGLLAEPATLDDPVDASLANAVTNLLHLAEEVGVDPLWVVSGALERYESSFEDGVGE